MAEVLSLQAEREARTPHMSGAAKCAACGHEWAAVAPAGVHELECPACASMKGHMQHSVMRGTERFECFCGCDVFRIHREHGPYCVNCAQPAQGWF